MKRLLKGLLVLIALVLLAYVVFLNYPKANIKSKDATERIAAVELYEAFTESETEAGKKYIGEVISVNGTIDEIYEDENQAPVVVLRSASGDPVVMITLARDQQSAIEKYNEGDPITIKALCSGMLMEVTLVKGIIDG